MRILSLTKRNLKEMMRDPISIIFSLVLPIAMLIVMELIFMSVKNVEMFAINNFAPAVCSFGFSFTMLYIALIISGDRSSAFMTRILVSPLKKYEYLSSYVLSGIPVMIVQSVIFYAVALIFGLKLDGYTILSVLFLLPSILFYLSCGILIGVIAKNDKQAGPISSIIITSAGLLGGIWMPLEQIGGTFFKICEYLPFYNGIRVARGVLIGDFSKTLISTAITLVFTIAVFVIAVVVFKHKSKKG